MSDKILKLSQAQTLYEDLRERIDALPTSGDIPSVPVQDVQINGTSILSNGVANVPKMSASSLGVAKVDSNNFGINVNGDGVLYLNKASDTLVKAGTNQYRPLTAYNQDYSTFYGLAKAAGADMASSSNAVGTYTDNAKQKIQNMLGITDLISAEESSTATIAHAINSTFMMNGKLHRATAAIAIGDAVEVGTNCEVVKADEVFVKKTDKATSSTPGLVRFANNAAYGIWYKNAPEDDVLRIACAGANEIKLGSSTYMPIVPAGQHTSIYYGLSKLAGVDLASETVTVGTYPETSKTAIRSLIGAAAASDIPSVPVEDVQINGTSIINNGVANIPIAGSNGPGVVTVNGNGIRMVNGIISTWGASDSQIKLATATYSPITPSQQHKSIFYGLSKLAGVDLANETVTLGQYPNTSRVAIRKMIDALGTNNISTGLSVQMDTETGAWMIETNIQDIQIDGTSIISNGIANLPYPNWQTPGVVKTNADYGLTTIAENTDTKGTIRIYAATDENIKAGTNIYRPIVSSKQHIATYYGLSKLAGVDLASETVTVGIYPATSKAAIRNLIGATSSNVIAVQDEQPTDADTKVWLPETEAAGIQVPTMEDMANYVQKTDLATGTIVGVVKANNFGIKVNNTGELYISKAEINSEVKPGVANYLPIVPSNQHAAAFYGLAKAAGDTTQALSDNAVGTYTTEAASAIRNMLGTVGTTDYATTDDYGLVKIGAGLYIGGSTGKLSVGYANSASIKNATNTSASAPVSLQHESVFYGLAKAAGDATQSISTNAVGTYTDDAKAAIQTMLGVPGDVQVNGTSVVSNGVANIPIASTTTAGVVIINGYGLYANASTGHTYIVKAYDAHIKAGAQDYFPIVPTNQHQAVFYGLAKAAGDTTQSASSNEVGTYTAEAKAAIHTMLGIDPASIAAQVDIPLVETVSGTTPTITGQPNVRYICGEVSTISITPPASGSVDVIFESGSTATTMTVPSTVKWPAWFDAEALEANTTYEVLITDGIYGSVMTWAT